MIGDIGGGLGRGRSFPPDLSRIIPGSSSAILSCLVPYSMVSLIFHGTVIKA